MHDMHSMDRETYSSYLTRLRCSPAVANSKSEELPASDEEASRILTKRGDRIFQLFPALDPSNAADHLSIALKEYPRQLFVDTNTIRDALLHLPLIADCMDSTQTTALVSAITSASRKRVQYAQTRQRRMLYCALFQQQIEESSADENVKRTIHTSIENLLHILPSLAFTPEYRPPSDDDAHTLQSALTDPIASDTVHAVRLVTDPQQDCDLAEGYHYNTILKCMTEGLYGQCTFIYLRGELIGSLKWLGNETMLALQTIRRSDDTYPLVRGGLYAVDSAIRQPWILASRQGRRFPRADVDELHVMPLRLLGQRPPNEEDTRDDYIQWVREAMERKEWRVERQE